MSAHLLLNLLNSLGKIDKMLCSRAFYRFFPASLSCSFTYIEADRVASSCLTLSQHFS